MVTVPVDGFPPRTDDGFSVTAEGIAGLTEILAVLKTPPPVAVSVGLVSPVTGFVVIVNVVDVAPAGTVTDAGIVAVLVFELVSVTLNPPVPAAPVMVTVPVDGDPPVTGLGLTLKLATAI
jgi:hypothetical protein